MRKKEKGVFSVTSTFQCLSIREQYLRQPLLVLIQAANDLISLLYDGDQLIHQLLLTTPILLTPVTLC